MRHFFLRFSILSFSALFLSSHQARAQEMNKDDMEPMAEKTSKVERPLTVPSNEATKAQLKLARQEGDAVNVCTSWIIKHVGSSSGQLKAGEYKITYAITAPEGWYNYNNNELSWQPAENANVHLWLFVQDGADGRIVPPLNISANVRDDSGNLVLSRNIPFAWTPLINGYGDNLKLPSSGKYTIQLKIDPMQYHRHDPYNGDRFSDLTNVELPIVINLEKIRGEKPFSEAMEKRLDISKGAGNAFANTLKAMYKQANDGRDTLTGDYKVAFAVEYAEGFWDFEHGKFRYKVENDLSGKTNGHVEVAVLDAKTGRFLHNLNVTATVLQEGKPVGTMMEHFMWHPWLYHYGNNWRFPKAGKYLLHIHFDPPAYKRYGKEYGRQFASAGDLEFRNVKIKTGQK